MRLFRRPYASWLCGAVALALGGGGLSAPSAPPPSLSSPGLHAGISFDTYPAIATADELIERFLSPFAREAVHSRLERSGERLKQQMFDIESEKFALYVPGREPPGGYGLLVFIPPWPQAEVPPAWMNVLDRHGIIFVSSARSGNDQNLLERRVPLALAALSDLKARFRIDPSRTFIGGFSGGSRVAMRVALAYPDLFSGALLNAGSDAIGRSPAQLPAAGLFLQFQTKTRLAYVTGEQDPGSLALDALSISSMHHWCVRNIAVRPESGAGHEVAAADAFNSAIEELEAEPETDSASMERCRAARLQDVHADLERAERLLADKRQADARAMLLEIDRRYGALAEPASLTLARRCSCSLLDGSGP